MPVLPTPHASTTTSSATSASSSASGLGGIARATVHPLFVVVVVSSCGARAARHPPYRLPSYRYPPSGLCGRATLLGALRASLTPLSLTPLSLAPLGLTPLGLALLSLTLLGGRACEGAVELASEGRAEVDLARGRVGVRVGVRVRVRVRV